MNLMIRVALLFLLFNALGVGAWSLLAPASFYQDFPNFSWAWVSVDGPYNEHLIRDVGGLQLGIAVLVLLALLKPSPTLLQAVALVTLAVQLPHNLYHLLHIAVLPDLTQQVAQTLGLWLGAVASVVVGWGWGRSAQPQ